MKMIFDSVTQLIGRTPIIKAKKYADVGADLYMKLESFNPGGSVKDRAALYMIEDAERSGLLKEGGTIIEATSGNTGISLAMIGAAKGMKVIIVMPDTMSIERRLLMKAYGAEVILTPGSLGMTGAVDVAKKMALDKGYFMPDQFNNLANVTAHVETTAKEILEEFGDKLNVFVAGVGSGGTLTGVARVLKQNNPNVKIIAVQPEKSQVLSGGSPSGHKIQCIGANFIPEILDRSIIDDIYNISEESAFEGSKRLSKEMGILAGVSSGANYIAAINIAKELQTNKKVLTVLPDTGERYLSAGLFEEN
ncbi:MAG: cysteine synthase A [Gudongella sp.]|nr:cysteine synthase A [Gudongella sp.]